MFRQLLQRLRPDRSGSLVSATVERRSRQRNNVTSVIIIITRPPLTREMESPAYPPPRPALL